MTQFGRDVVGVHRPPGREGRALSPLGLLGIYCALILLASLIGGWIPLFVRLTHRRLEVALSFVSGVMLGIALMHLLPHALVEYAASIEAGHDHGAEGHHALDAVVLPITMWLVGGFLAMFLIERYFCFHHHAPADEGEGGHAVHTHHTMTWGGAAIGLTLHSLIAGVGLAASVLDEQRAVAAALPAGFATFLVIVLHKPFDALTIGTLMAAGRRGTRARHAANVLFALAVPVGAGLLLLGVSGIADDSPRLVAVALAFAAGMFLCIALSDLLPELQFHRHDRFKLSVALVLGILLAAAISGLEGVEG